MFVGVLLRENAQDEVAVMCDTLPLYVMVKGGQFIDDAALGPVNAEGQVIDSK